MLDPQYWSLGRTALQANRAESVLWADHRSAGGEPEPATVQRYRLLRGMPQFDGASRSERNGGDSNYHALQMKWEKRFSDGVNVLTHYTWSKMIDNASVGAGNLTWLGGTTSMQNPMNYDLERSLSAHDIPHRVCCDGLLERCLSATAGSSVSNANRLIDAFIGGWEVSGFLTLQSGVPLQVSQSGGTLWNGTQRPHLIGDPSTEGRVQDRLNSYFNPATPSRSRCRIPSAPRRAISATVVLASGRWMPLF